MMTLHLEGIHLYAYHGCYESENKIGSPYVVQVSIETKDMQAVETDNLADAIDYTKVYDIVREEMAISSKLIEHVGGRILKSLKKAFGDVSFEIKIMKINPPVHGEVEKVSVVLKG